MFQLKHICKVQNDNCRHSLKRLAHFLLSFIALVAGVSFDDTPTSSALEGLQSARDKIKAAPRNRRPPTRTHLGGSALKKTAPMKPHRKTKPNPTQGVQEEKPKVTNSKVVFEASAVMGKENGAELEEVGGKETDGEKTDVGKEGETVLKIDEEKPKGKWKEEEEKKLKGLQPSHLLQYHFFYFSFSFFLFLSTLSCSQL